MGKNDGYSKIKFSILVPTYNRHDLVKKTIKSLLMQTYKDFEILVCDHGSTPPVDNIVKMFNDSRIKYFRYDENMHFCDLGEDSLNNISGSYFLFLADDDALVPSALEIVAGIIKKYRIDSLGVGLAHFDHTTCQNINKYELTEYSGKLQEFAGYEVGLHCCNTWGIGAKHNYKAPKVVHSSGLFFSKRIIDITRNKQRELFIKPFGDIGYVGVFFNVEKTYYLDLPLAVIGTAPIREMDGAILGRRNKWDKEVQWLEHTPIKGSSFTNMGADGHLKVLFRNDIHKKYDFTLRPTFYMYHLLYVVSDRPWTKTTLRDIAECIPHLIRSCSKFQCRIVSVLDNSEKLFKLINKSIHRNLINKIFMKNSSSGKKFNDINDFALYVDDNFVKPRRFPGIIYL